MRIGKQYEQYGATTGRPEPPPEPLPRHRHVEVSIIVEISERRRAWLDVEYGFQILS